MQTNIVMLILLAFVAAVSASDSIMRSIVPILLRDRRNGTTTLHHYCAGAIIKDNYVIAAARCFDRKFGKDGVLFEVNNSEILIYFWIFISHL